MLIDKEHRVLIGVLGGTFDPVHNGHIHIANQLYQQLPFQEIRFIPCKQPVHRHHPHASVSQRLAMLNLALAEGRDHFIIDEREIHRSTPSYMIETLSTLRQENPHQPIALIIGMDSFANFDCWHQWQHIPEYAHLIIVNRPLYHIPVKPALQQLLQSSSDKNSHQHNNDIHQLISNLTGLVIIQKIEPIAISATAIRLKLSLEEDVSNDLPLPVCEYIKQQGIYKQESTLL